MGRRAPLLVFGPPGLRRFTATLLDAWGEDIDVRVKRLERENRDWLKVDAHEVREGLSTTATGCA